MNIICMVSFYILFLCSLFFYRTLKHPAVIFNILWSVLIQVSIVGYPGINPPDAQIYGIFLFGGIVLNVAAFFANYAKTNTNGELTKSNSGSNDLSQFMYEVTNKQLKILSLVQLILMAYYIVKAVGLINDLLTGFSYGDIRSYYYSEQYLSSQIEYLVLTYVFDPLLTLTQILFGVNLFTKSIKTSVSGIMLINILLRTFISGGRMLLLELVVIIAVCYFVIGKTKKISLKQKVGMFVLLLAATSIAVIITTERGREGTFFEKIQEMLVVNFTGSFTYLNHLMNNGKFIDKSFGAASFAGIIDTIVVLFRFLGIIDLPTKQIEIGNITQSFTLIGTYSYNAMPTMYYFFMTDFGKIGNLIMPLLLGVISTKIYKKLISAPSIQSLVLYLFCILVIVESPMTWLPFKSSFMLAVFISLKLFSKKRRVVE